MATTLSKPEKQESTPLRTLFRRGPLRNLRDEMQEFFSNVMGGELEGWPLGQVAPTLDVSETNGSVEVRMDLPGMKPEDIDIQVNGNLLMVSGERREEKEETDRAFHRVERRMGSFSRSLTLPCAIREEKVDARYRDGVLSITLPKTDEAKSRKVQVKS